MGTSKSSNGVPGAGCFRRVGSSASTTVKGSGAPRSWKRERYAPSFHLDDENLDPKTWCRWPLLSGGFATELAELRQRLAELP